MKNYSKENLDVTHYRNGDSIPFVKSKKEWSNLTIGAYCYYDDNPEKGVLYNWYAVNDSRGLAPKGWKIPTIEELEQMDLTACLPGGCRFTDGSYYAIVGYGYWWSSTEFKADSAWYRNLYLTNGAAGSYYDVKRDGLSVRCLKEEIVINKSKNMEVVIDGILYVPKELEKKVEPVILEKNYKFKVHPSISNDKLNWDDAIDYAKNLGDGWRLPTIEECFIMYTNKVITDEVYWNSSEYNNNLAWYFNFNNGYANFNNKNNTYFVRAVRSI